MKALILILVTSVVSCCSTRNKTANRGSGQPVADSTVSIHKQPACINDLIASFETEQVQNPPRKIYSYTYQGRKVYYVPAICCDFFSDLYDSNCKLIGHPDGGFTGKGDGKLPDFNSVKTDEVLVWADKRK